MASETRQITYAEAIREAYDQALARDENVIVIGLGVPDIGNIFGTTKDLQEKYGADRVMDMPLAENGITGVCIGAAIAGLRPVLMHQRIDFALLSMDQIINNAAKWKYMFQRQKDIPLVIRVLIGRGWGQGPQHSQSLQALFAHIPGLKVVMPTFPADVKGMTIAAIEDESPVILFEHRWLHHTEGQVPSEPYTTPLDRAKVVRPGTQVTIAAFSFMTIESLRAARALAGEGIDIEVIDMRSCRPLDFDAVQTSLAKTGILIVADTGWTCGGISAELVAAMAENHFDLLKQKPYRIASPDLPTPTSPAVADDYYPDAITIVDCVLGALGNDDAALKERVFKSLKRKGKPDQPHIDYKGPF